jgi:hypothetical protein
MTARILFVVFVALAAALGAHLLAVLMLAAVIAVLGALLILLAAIARTLIRTGGGIVPVREAASW